MQFADKRKITEKGYQPTETVKLINNVKKMTFGRRLFACYENNWFFVIYQNHFFVSNFEAVVVLIRFNKLGSFSFSLSKKKLPVIQIL